MNTIQSVSNVVRRVALAAMAASITVAVVAAPAFGRLHNQIRVTIPFAFSVGKTAMPAGEYTVQDIANGALHVKSMKGDESTIALGRLETEEIPAEGTPTLVFNRYGSECFLSEVRTGWDQSVYKFRATAVEERLAREGNGPSEVLLVKATVR